MFQEQEEDVTTNAHAADALIVRANKLDLLERLADDLAHEIKNPLHSMVINLEVLKRRIARRGPDDESDVQRYIGVLATELERVNRRIELLLRLTRPTRSAEPATPEELVEELLELLQLEGRKQDVEVRFEPTPQAARVHVARGPVRQLILDVALEVLDRVPAGGALVIRTGPARDGVGVFICGSDGEGASVPLGADPDADRRLATARMLAERVGGRLEAAAGADGSADSCLLFSLPRVGG